MWSFDETAYRGQRACSSSWNRGGFCSDVAAAELAPWPRGQVDPRFLAQATWWRIQETVDHAEHGGALLLGVNGICVIGHGSSKALSGGQRPAPGPPCASHGASLTISTSLSAGLGLPKRP